MLAVWIGIAIVMGLAVGTWAGFALGERIRRAREPRRAWWRAAVGAWVFGFTVTFAGMVIGNLPLQVLGVSLVVGAITGLKYGGAEFAAVFRMPQRPSASGPAEEGRFTRETDPDMRRPADDASGPKDTQR